MLPLRYSCIVAVALTCLVASAQDADDPVVDLIVNLLGEKDKDLRALGFEQVRTEAKGEAATKRFAAELPKLAAEGQVGLLRALGDRGDKAARAAVLKTLEATKDQAVRLAAIAAIGSLGQRQELPLLIELLGEGSKDEKTAARTSLVRLQGGDVSKAIVAEMKEKPSSVRVALIEILEGRRALDAIPDLIRAADDEVPAVRKAAMAALGQLARPEDLTGMVRGVLKADKGAEREAAEKAIMFVCARIPKRDTRAAPLLEAIEKLDQSDRLELLPTLGRVGGSQALPVVEAAIASKDPQRHDVGIRALCNWPDASVASGLVELAQNAQDPQHRTMALAALIRIAPLPDGRPDTEKLALVRQVMQMCRTDEQRKLLLKRASAIRTVETLRFVVPYLDNPTYAEQACESIVELAHHRGLREPNKTEFHRALDRVIATSKDAVVLDRAKRYKNDQTWVRPTAVKTSD